MKNSTQKFSENLRSKVSPELFIVKKVTFEQGNTDPFRFDDLTEKIGGIYVPFSGSIRRVRYLVFLPLVQLLIEELNLDRRNALIAKTRFEKLLVYLAIHMYHVPTGSGIMGISLKGVDPFYPHTGKWIVVDSFNLYGNSVKSLGLDQEIFIRKLKNVYLSNRLKKFAMEFLNRQGSLDEHRSWLLKSNRQKAVLANSPFNIKKKINPGILNFISKQIFNSKGIQKITAIYSALEKTPGRVIDKLKKDEKFPFIYLNRFYLACFRALDNEMGGESKGTWQKAFVELKRLRNSPHNNVLNKSAGVSEWKKAVSPTDLKTRLYSTSKKYAPSWFEFSNGKISKGAKYPEGYLEYMVAGDRANFRLPALASIIDDINNGGI